MDTDSQKMDRDSACRVLDDQIKFLQQLSDDNFVESTKFLMIQNLQILRDTHFGQEIKKCKLTPMCSTSTNTDAQPPSVSESESPEQILFRVHIVLKKILNFLPLRDLKNLRLLSSSWNEIVSTQILSNNPHHFRPLIFQFHSQTNEFRHYSKKTTSHKYLDELVDCIKNSNKFPISHFHFNEIGIKEKFHPGSNWLTGFQLFFKLQGQHIKTLHLSPTSSPIHLDLPMLTSILLHEAPNVENLELSYFNNIVWTDSNRLILPRLKSLKCLHQNSESTAFQFLSQAPSLESVHNFKIKYIDLYLSKFKGKFIKSYNMEYVRNIVLDITNFVKFADSGPRLETLKYEEGFDDDSEEEEEEDEKFSLYKKKYVEAFNRILKSSQDTLTFLSSVDGNLATPGIEFPPKFPHLRTLELSQDVLLNEDETEKKPKITVPPSIILSKLCPRLKTFRFNCTVDMSKVGENEMVLSPEFFKGYCRRVKTLQLNVVSFKFWLKKFSRLMPNVSKLIVMIKYDVPKEEYIRLIHYHFPYLKKLVIDDEGDLEYNVQCLRNILSDCQFTGIAEYKCKELREGSGKPRKDIETYKEKPGLQDFDDLKSLKIRLMNSSWDEEGMSNLQLPSHVSGLEGFQKPCQYDGRPAEKIDVTVVYNDHCRSAWDVESALKSIKPYVKLVDYKDEETDEDEDSETFSSDHEDADQ